MVVVVAVGVSSILTDLDSLTTVAGSLGGVGPAGTSGGSLGRGVGKPDKLRRNLSALTLSHTIPSSPVYVRSSSLVLL